MNHFPPLRALPTPYERPLSADDRVLIAALEDRWRYDPEGLIRGRDASLVCAAGQHAQRADGRIPEAVAQGVARLALRLGHALPAAVVAIAHAVLDQRPTDGRVLTTHAEVGAW